MCPKQRIEDISSLKERDLEIIFSDAALEKIQDLAADYGSADLREVVQKALDLLYTARDSKIILEDKKTGRRRIIEL